MCRFLLVRSIEWFQPAEMLASFARMCEVSRAPDGDRQGDGWGVAWKEDGAWQLHKSLRPIWEEEHTLRQIPSTRLLAAHARSAGFVEHKGNLIHNQPYLADESCFVFNGMIRGVRLPMKTEGEIGAQKIFSLLRKGLESRDGAQALAWLDDMIVHHSRQLVGMNIGMVHDDRFYLLCEYGERAEYFGLNYAQTGNGTIVCSERLPGYDWQTMEKGQVLVL